MSLLRADEPLGCQKPLFSLPDGLHYLNCAYMAPLSKTVEGAGMQGVRRKAVPCQIKPEDFFTESGEAKRLFAELVNAEAERVALIPSVSYGVATVARNLKPKRGQSIVLLHEQFPSNVYAWRSFAEQGIELRTVAPPETGPRGEAWNARLLNAIDESTALVTLPHIHWTDGTLFDLSAVGARAREVGACFVVDGTQSVGALAFDVARIQPDALIVAGYKTLMGPYGLGLAYYGPRFDRGDPLEDTWIARRGSEDFGRLVDYQDDYADGAVRYDVGERSNPILLPMMIAALEHLLAWRPGRVQTYCQTLMSPAARALQDLGYGVEAPAGRAHHLFGVRLPPGGALDRVKACLEHHNVYVSVRGDVVRVAPSVYNDEADVEALVAALTEALD